MEQVWKDILEYARWAPSPHNIQPWKVRIVSPEKIDIFYQPDRLLPKTDPTGRFTTAGFGTFVESIAITARGFGYDIDYSYTGTRLDPSLSGPQFFISVTLVKREVSEPLDKELLLKRRTSRLQYDDVPVETELKEKLVAIARDFGEKFVITDDPASMRWIKYLNKETMFYDMNDENARTEVGSWVRYLSKEAHQKNDGLWSYCMGFAPWVMYLFFNARWIFNLPILKQLIGAYYMWSMRGTRTVGWLSGAFNTPEEWFLAGRMLCRLWLSMTAHNVYLHPFGSVITNEKAHNMFLKHFNITETQESTLWLIMRMGHSDLPPRSLRIGLEEILIP